MLMSRIDTLNPQFHEIVNRVRLQFLKETGYELWVTSCTRTIKEQHGLYIRKNDGIDNDGDGRVDEADEKVTNADGGQSSHNFGKGCDCVPVKNGKEWWEAPKSLWAIYGRIAEEHGLTWGGHFKKLYDAPHVEDPSWKQDQALWRQGKITVA